jgi:hypothetical protein
MSAYTYAASIAHARDYIGITITRYRWGTMDRVFPREDYTVTDAAVTADWLNEREAGYPAHALPATGALQRAYKIPEFLR